MKCPSQTRVKRKKGRETEKKTANEQICLREDMRQTLFPGKYNLFT